MSSNGGNNKTKTGNSTTAGNKPPTGNSAGNAGNKPPTGNSAGNAGNKTPIGNSAGNAGNKTPTGNSAGNAGNKTPTVNSNAGNASAKSAANAENLSELLGANNSDIFGVNTTPATTNNNAAKTSQTANNTSAKNKSANQSGVFGDLFGTPTTAPTATNSTKTSPANVLVESTETAIKSASNKLSEVKEAVTDRIGELSSGSNLGMNLLKIGLTILILVALFYVAKYLFTRYQDSVYNSPMLLDGMKNGKHALVISQDPANPSYVPMPKSDDQTSLEFTYDFWMLIDSYEYKKGEWKHLFHKGNSSSYPNRAPGIWLHPDTNAMRVYMNTQDNILEYVDVDNLPLRKWIHVSLVLHDMDLDVFINGYLKKRQKLTSVPKLNNGDFWVNMFGGFEGYLARIRYYAKAISVDEIAANVRAGPGDSACIDTGQVPPYLDDDWWVQ